MFLHQTNCVLNQTHSKRGPPPDFSGWTNDVGGKKLTLLNIVFQNIKALEEEWDTLEKLTVDHVYLHEEDAHDHLGKGTAKMELAMGGPNRLELNVWDRKPDQTLFKGEIMGLFFYRSTGSGIDFGESEHKIGDVDWVGRQFRHWRLFDARSSKIVNESNPAKLQHSGRDIFKAVKEIITDADLIEHLSDDDDSKNVFWELEDAASFPCHLKDRTYLNWKSWEWFSSTILWIWKHGMPFYTKELRFVPKFTLSERHCRKFHNIHVLAKQNNVVDVALDSSELIKMAEAMPGHVLITHEYDGRRMTDKLQRFLYQQSFLEFMRKAFSPALTRTPDDCEDLKRFYQILIAKGDETKPRFESSMGQLLVSDTPKYVFYPKNEEYMLKKMCSEWLEKHVEDAQLKKTIFIEGSIKAALQKHQKSYRV